MMNRKEYLVRLKAGLNRLPEEETAGVLAYYEEYFEEAGAENEQAVIEELGDPRDVAGRVIAEMAVRYMREPESSPKKRMRGVWIGALAVLASPIAVPLALAAVMLIFAMLLTAGALALTIVLVGASAVLYAVIGIFAGIYCLFTAPATGVAILGGALIAGGISAFVIKGGIQAGRWVYQGTVSFMARLLRRRRSHAG